MLGLQIYGWFFILKVHSFLHLNLKICVRRVYYTEAIRRSEERCSRRTRVEAWRVFSPMQLALQPAEVNSYETEFLGLNKYPSLTEEKPNFVLRLLQYRLTCRLNLVVKFITFIRYLLIAPSSTQGGKQFLRRTRIIFLYPDGTQIMFCLLCKLTLLGSLLIQVCSIEG